MGLETERVENPSRPSDPRWPGLYVDVIPLIDCQEPDAGEIFEQYATDRGEIQRQPE